MIVSDILSDYPIDSAGENAMTSQSDGNSLDSVRPFSRRAVLKGLAATGAGLWAGQGPVLGQTGPVRIGALLPLTGDADAYAIQMRAGIEVAAGEINDAGGIQGRPIEILVRDSETSPGALPKLCRELVETQGVAALVGPWIAAGRRLATRYLAAAGVPLVNASNHEGRYCSTALFSVGPTTAHDGHALVRHLDEAGAGKRYFLLGSYPSWQNAMFRQIRFPMAPRGIKVLGQALTDVGERDFRPVIRWIEELGAEVVLFCVMRHHGGEFIRQARASGLLDRVTIGWIGYNETLDAGLDPDDAARIVTTAPFVASDTVGAGPEFVARVRNHIGAPSPVSHVAFTHYNAVMALRAAWERSGEVSAAAAIAGLKGLTFDSPTGPVTIDAANQHATMNIVVARGGGLQVIERLGPIAPDPGCTVAQPA
jgi:branched-chain amino acid transport system substrate-binding protein/urea transport system substrate-binding protein